MHSYGRKNGVPGEHAEWITPYNITIAPYNVNVRACVSRRHALVKSTHTLRACRNRYIILLLFFIRDRVLLGPVRTHTLSTTPRPLGNIRDRPKTETVGAATRTHDIVNRIRTTHIRRRCTYIYSRTRVFRQVREIFEAGR